MGRNGKKKTSIAIAAILCILATNLCSAKSRNIFTFTSADYKYSDYYEYSNTFITSVNKKTDLLLNYQRNNYKNWHYNLYGIGYSHVLGKNVYYSLSLVTGLYSNTTKLYRYIGDITYETSNTLASVVYKINNYDNGSSFNVFNPAITYSFHKYKTLASYSLSSFKNGTSGSNIRLEIKYKPDSLNEFLIGTIQGKYIEETSSNNFLKEELNALLLGYSYYVNSAKLSYIYERNTVKSYLYTKNTIVIDMKF